MGKIKWKGGKYGILPHVNVGDFCYVIRDMKIEDKWKYVLVRKTKVYSHKVHTPKNIERFQYLIYSEKIFLRWYKLKHKYSPIKTNLKPCYKTIVYTDTCHRFLYYVDEKEIRRIDTGIPISGFFNTMAEAKREVEPIILRAIAEYEESNQFKCD